MIGDDKEPVDVEARDRKTSEDMDAVFEGDDFGVEKV